MESPPEPPFTDQRRGDGVPLRRQRARFSGRRRLLVVSVLQVRQFAGGASNKKAAVVRARGGARGGRGPGVRFYDAS